MHLPSKICLLVLLSSFAFISCDNQLKDFQAARNIMDEAANRIYSVQNDTHVESVDPYVPARIIFELKNYTHACEQALTATNGTLAAYANGSPLVEDSRALKQFYNQNDLNSLEQQFSFILSTNHAMELVCLAVRNDLKASCEELNGSSPRLISCISKLDSSYAKMLRIL